MGNKICVSLGSSDPAALKNLIGESLQNNADFIEVRFDYLDKTGIEKALEAVLEQKERAVFTCRTPKEGGKFNGSEDLRVTILRRFAAFRPMLLDVEYSTMAANDDLMDQFIALNCDTLVSWHNFEATPDISELEGLMGKMREYSSNVKIVTTAQNLGDNLKVLRLYDSARRSNTNLISFCMGEHGTLSRVLCTYAGAPFTYASLTDATAPGQLTVKQMRAIYERLEKEKTELSNYDSWKYRQEFGDIIKIIGEVRSAA